MKVANFNGVGGGTILYTAHFPQDASFGLQGALARRRRRRLADRLLDAGAVLCRERPHDGRLRPGRRSGLSTPRSADAADPARQDRNPLRAGDEQARLALVAVGHHRSRRPSTMGARRASTSATARLAARRVRRRAPTSPTGRAPSAPASNCAPAAGCGRSPPTSTAWPPAPSTTTPTESSNFSRRRWSSWPATASARRACCSTRHHPAFPTGLPIPADWSART